MDKNKNIKKVMDSHKAELKKIREQSQKEINELLNKIGKGDKNVSMDTFLPTPPVDFRIDVDFECRPNYIEAYTPEYKTALAVGCDVKADIEKPITLKPLERFAFPTGLYYKLPSTLEIQVRSRSGLAYKHGICVLNSPATIDPDYINEEIKVILVNNSNEDYTVEVGERISQIVFSPIVKVKHHSKNLNEICLEEKRGGLGSTGKL